MPGGLPLGNLLLAVGFVAGAAIPLQVMPGGAGFRVAGRATMLLAVPWFPVSWLLAGNLGLNFLNAPGASAAYGWLRAGTVTAVIGMNLANLTLIAASALELGNFDE